ncbi:MAG: pilus assembly PilX N-terminal domain-containing protein [Candidatus Eisenbacteria bacterium]
MKTTPRVRRLGSEEGSTLLIALLVLGSLSILATTIVVSAMGDRNLSKYERHSLMALGAAESGIAWAKRQIVTQTANMTDYDADGRPDFTLSDSLSSGGSFSVVAEASDIKGLGITAYQSNGFAIVSEGHYLGAVRRVKAEIVHDSFLKFARFVSVNNLSYACGAVLTGEVYTGGDLVVPCGCSSGQEAQFLESAYAVNDIPNAGCGIFYRGYVTDAEQIDLENSFDWTDTQDKAQGRAAENDCENKGDAGIYIKIGTSDPLSTGTNVINLSLFDFYDVTTVPGDTIITYGGTPVPHPQHFPNPMKYSEFNGMIVVVGDADVQGEMDGTSAHPITIFATDDLIVSGDIIAGHTGFDEITRAADGSGDPINIGLVAEDYVEIKDTTSRVLRIDGALFSRTNTWRSTGTTTSHPVAGNGAHDLDLDGITGESPVNHDPIPGTGWDEVITGTNASRTWVLNINGPIITKYGGSAYPWNDSGVLANADGPTRRYNYDLDVTEFPPPCYPVPLNLWKEVSWTEIFDVRTDLASHLPN